MWHVVTYRTYPSHALVACINYSCYMYTWLVGLWFCGMPESCKTTGTMDVPWSGRRSFRAAVLLALLAAGLPPLCSAARKRYSSHWLVEVEGGMEMANMIANKHKLLNLGPVRGKREREREKGEVVRLQTRIQHYMRLTNCLQATYNRSLV